MSGKLFKSSFLWFLIIGGLIFYLDAQFNRAGEDIVVDERVVTRIASLWQQQMDRPPSDYELRNLINNWIDEEMLFREAKRLSLDREDIIVKRRLVQKMQFIAEEADVAEPTEGKLRDYFEEHQEKYLLPRRFTLSHVFYRERPGADASAALAAARDNAWRSLGDATMLRPSYVQRSQRELATDFGMAFAEAINALTAAPGWQGPIKSEFGWHLVRLESIAEPATPAYITVRNQVLNDFLFKEKSQAKQRQLDKLRRHYNVIW
ncbi:MAG: peptidyl-prolyl cis-trans isomerase, partial [Pseudomonadales bacterium]